MAQMIVGLDVGTTSIKVARIEASLFRFDFQGFQEHTLPTGTDLSWEQLVTNVLRVIFAEPGARADRVITNLPGRNVSSRMIPLPFSDRKKIQQTLPFEVEGLIPLPLESILIDYQVIASGPEGSRSLVFFTEKETLRAHLALLRDAGVDPHAILPVPVALANLWKELPPRGDDPCAVIDIGDRETSLAVLHHGKLLFGRSWATGSGKLTLALAEALGVSTAQAREVKEKEASILASSGQPNDPEARKIEAVLKTALGPVAVGIKQTLLSVREFTGLPVSTAWLCGNASRLSGLSGFLSDALQMDVQPLTLHGPVGALLQEQGSVPASAATALGLAFHGVRDMRASRFNLRTGEFVYVSERAELRRQLVNGGIMAGVLLVMLFLVFGLNYSDRSRRVQALNNSLETMAVETFPELTRIPAGKPRIDAMTVRLTQARQENELFVPLSPESLSVLDILREITQAVPADVQIDVRELILEGDRIRLEADTGSYIAAEQIMKNLLASGLFASADIPEAKDSLDQTRVNFRMNLQLHQKIL